MATVSTNIDVDVDVDIDLNDIDEEDMIEYLENKGYKLVHSSNDIISLSNDLIYLLKERYSIYNKQDVYDAVNDLLSVSTLK